MTQEALKLALEALENSVDLVVEDAYNAEQLYGNYPTRQGKVGGLKILADQHKEAITAIKEVLAQTEQEPLKIFQYNCTCGRTMKFESVHGVVAPQRTEQNFCSRCGKRVGGIDSIHTCTPPMEMNT